MHKSYDLINSESLINLIYILFIMYYNILFLIQKRLFSSFVYVILLSYILCSCNSKNAKIIKLIDHKDYFQLSLNYNVPDTFAVNITLDDSITFFQSLMRNYGNYADCHYIDLLKTDSVNICNIVYILARNDGNIKIRIQGYEMDTTFIHHLDLTNKKHAKVKVLSGTCASLHSLIDSTSFETNIKDWAALNKRYLDNSFIEKMDAYYKELNKSVLVDFETLEKIPIISKKEAQYLTYRLSSNMKSDYYYLIHCNNYTNIHDFVQEKISNKFIGAVSSLNQQLPLCLDEERKYVSSYNFVLFLVGINKDGSYQSAPVGFLFIDNLPPNKSMLEHSSFYINDINGIQTINFENFSFSLKKPEISGSLKIETGDYTGDLSMLNVPITFIFEGDIKCVRIYNSKKTFETINLEGKQSPYQRTVRIYLNDLGTNYVRYDVIDIRDNIDYDTINEDCNNYCECRCEECNCSFDYNHYGIIIDLDKI